jgi:PAS domain-containing protein
MWCDTEFCSRIEAFHLHLLEASRYAQNYSKENQTMSQKDGTHKSMAGASHSSDHESSSSLNTNSIILVTRRDIGPLVLAVLIVILGVAVCLISYFTVAAKEAYDTQQALQTDSVSGLKAIQSSFAQVTITAKYIYSYFDDNPYPDFITQDILQEFTESESREFPSYIYSVSFAPLVYNQNRTDFVAAMRAQEGTSYSSYNIRDTSGAVRGTADLYMPIKLIVPFQPFSSSIGLDLYSIPDVAALIMEANLTDHSVLSKKYLLSASGYGNLIIFAPYAATTTQMYGVVAASVDTLGVVKNALGDTFLDSGVQVSLYSLNYTTNPKGDFAYSTISGNDSAVAAAISSAQCVAEGTVTLSDNVFRVVFSSTNTYIKSHTSALKYVGIIVSCVCTVVLVCMCFLIMFFIRILRTLKSRSRGKRRLQALQEQYSSTSSLLERLVRQDAILRACMNAIPDFIVTLNGFGKITNTNKAFDELFGYSEQRLENGLTIQWLFPSLDSSFFREAKIDGEMLKIEGKALTAQENAIDVVVFVRGLQNGAASEETLNQRNDLTAVTELQVGQEEHAYVMIGRKIDPTVTEVAEV